MTTPPEPVYVDEVGPARLVRLAGGPVAALRILTRAVAAAHAETVVVCAAPVAARPDVFELVADQVGPLPPGSALAGSRVLSARPVASDGIRLVLLGRGRDRAERERGGAWLADRLGVPVTVALGPVTVAADGTCAAAASSETGGGWLRCAPDREPRRLPPWSPVPNWPDVPVLGADVAGGRVVAHAVPAGIWLLPRGVAAAGAGVVANLPRVGAALTVFAGGGAWPLDPDDVSAVLAALALPRSARLVLLPGAVDAVMTQPYVGAVPVLDARGWRLAPVGYDGRLVPPAADLAHPVTGPTHPAAVDLAHPAVTGGADPAADRADPATGPGDAGGRWWSGPPPGRPTPAGWSFLDRAPVGIAPLAAGALVEVAAAGAGFQVDGRTVTAAEFAPLVRATVAADADVILVGGAYPIATLYGLTEALDADVVIATGPVTVTAHGLLATTGTFHRWHRGQPPVDAGPVLPAGGVVPDSTAWFAHAPVPPERPRVPLPRSAPPVDGRRWPGIGHVARRAIRIRPTSPAPAPVPDRVVPVGACDPGDRRRLALALPDSFKQHTNHVVSVLSGQERPGATDPVEPEAQARTVAALVALRAYWGEYREPVNQWLHGGSDPDGRAALLARCARAALSQLPLAVGPVFAAVAERPVYEPGWQLVEPGFVEAGLAPADCPDDGVEYVIWSMTARQLGRVVHSGTATALFAPGSRFTVLGREPWGGRTRVFLAETLDGGLAASVFGRLRAAAAAPVAAPVVAPGWPIGLDPSGRPVLAVHREDRTASAV